VELVLSSEVHPYDLLKYEHAIFSKAAFETLQETLKKAVSKRQHAAATEEPKAEATKKVVRKKKEAV
jgi:large subunit ribosomal protein L4